jgi:hypothetical protein
MSFTINSMVFKVFLPILVGLAIFGTLDSIKVNSLEPNVNSLDEALGSFNREIVLAGAEENEPLDEDRARDKYREAVIFNVLSAQHCGLIGKADEAKVVGDYDQFGNEIVSGLVQDFISNPSVLGEETQYEPSIFYPGSSKPYNVLNESGFSLTCAGGDQISSNMPGISQITENEGNDMEGQYGRIGFEVDNTFTIDDARIAAFSFPGIDSDGTYPAMLLGLKTISAAPEGCSEGFYNGKLKMQNIPVIAEGNAVQNYDLCNPEDFSKMIQQEPEAISYLMCEGAQGYIQTNIGDIQNSGEATSGTGSQITSQVLDFLGLTDSINSELLNVETYPRMIARQKAASCIDEGGKDLLVEDESKVIAPKLDFGSGRESCSFQDVKNYHEEDISGRNWNGLNVKCGLVEDEITQEGGGGFNYYNTVWYAEEGQTCNRDEYSHKVSYDITSDPDSGPQERTFDLSRFSEIENIDVRFARNEKSEYNVILNGERIVTSSWREGGNKAPGYYVRSLEESNNQDWSEKEIPNSDESIAQDYILRLNKEDYVSWSGTAGNFPEEQDFESLKRSYEIPDNPSKLTFRVVPNSEGESSRIKIESISVRGDLRACS